MSCDGTVGMNPFRIFLDFHSPFNLHLFTMIHVSIPNERNVGFAVELMLSCGKEASLLKNFGNYGGLRHIWGMIVNWWILPSRPIVYKLEWGNSIIP
mmetsp:Transcript_11535/g.23322  ORF Transcript_11535/g.23322 Transcript_11535/m.23322 type:complete len:97 (-) Transcript_11535:70-360(-)